MISTLDAGSWACPEIDVALDPARRLERERQRVRERRRPRASVAQLRDLPLRPAGDRLVEVIARARETPQDRGSSSYSLRDAFFTRRVAAAL